MRGLRTGKTEANLQSSGRRLRRVETTAPVALALALSGFTAAAAAALDPAPKAFLAKFADIAAQGAVDPMTKVTRFPLKNRVFQQPERIGPAEFPRYFARNGFRELATCLKTTPPRRVGKAGADLGDWVVDCDGNSFYFAREGGDWRFTGFENANE